MKQLVYAFILCSMIQSVLQAMEPVSKPDECNKKQHQTIVRVSSEFRRAQRQRLIRRPSDTQVIRVMEEKDDGVAKPRGILGCCTSATPVREAPTTRQPLTDKQRQLVDREMRAADTKELFYAVLRQEPKNVLYALLEGYADVNYKDGIGWAPLHYAARDRSVEIFKVLLAVKGIDTNATDGLGRTVRQVIASRRDCATAEHQALCDEMTTLLEAHSAGYPFEIRGNKLMIVGTDQIVLSANENE